MCEPGLMHYIAVNDIVASVPDIMLLCIYIVPTHSFSLRIVHHVCSACMAAQALLN